MWRDDKTIAVSIGVRDVYCPSDLEVDLRETLFSFITQICVHLSLQLIWPGGTTIAIFHTQKEQQALLPSIINNQCCRGDICSSSFIGKI